MSDLNARAQTALYDMMQRKDTEFARTIKAMILLIEERSMHAKSSDRDAIESAMRASDDALASLLGER